VLRVSDDLRRQGRARYATTGPPRHRPASRPNPSTNRRDHHIWPVNWENAVLILPRMVHHVRVGKGQSIWGWPFVVSGERELEVGSDGVIRDDRDFVDEGFEECLAGVVRFFGEYVSDLGPNSGQVGRVSA
jgi:hypothetical protein